MAPKKVKKETKKRVFADATHLEVKERLAGPFGNRVIISVHSKDRERKWLTVKPNVRLPLMGDSFVSIFHLRTYSEATIIAKAKYLNDLSLWLSINVTQRSLYVCNLEDAYNWGLSLCERGMNLKSLTNYMGTTIQFMKLRNQCNPKEDELRAWSIRWEALKRITNKTAEDQAVIPTVDQFLKLSKKHQGQFNFHVASGLRLLSLSALTGEEMISKSKNKWTFTLGHLKAIARGYAGPRVATICCNCESNPNVGALFCPIHCEKPIQLPIEPRDYCKALHVAGFSSHSARRLLAVWCRSMLHFKVLESKFRIPIFYHFLWAYRKDLKTGLACSNEFNHYSRDFLLCDLTTIPPYQQTIIKFLNLKIS